ncbi:B3 domain-containing protein REM20-like [Salvia hispanica]|uniref:B3 domain-containing protein REM20-like n=1 Tax=Salvia hispanica TaxID=49212 RepID=UPI0020093CA1|nr:B3 domain-containing protein REM20-like [Salvia hispanica]
MGGEGANYPPNGPDDYHRLPTFLKVYRLEKHKEEMRLPPEFVGIHGGDLPFDCRLVWPNRVRHIVRILKLANGFYFCTGWPQFVHANGIEHGDYLTFTLVDVGTFNVRRYDMGTHCPRRMISIVIVEDDNLEECYSPDVDTSDDYCPSEVETDSSQDDDYEDDSGALDVDGYPTFVLTLTKTNINRTIEIPYRFWQRHIRMGALEAAVFLLAEGETWRVTLKHKGSKIWVKHGWGQFKTDNQLVEGVRCHFKLVDADDVQFFVWFERP